MGIPELKEIIRLRLENADENILKIVASLLDNQSEDIVALDANGLPRICIAKSCRLLMANASLSPYKLRGSELVRLTARKGVASCPSKPTALLSQPLAVLLLKGVPLSI